MKNIISPLLISLLFTGAVYGGEFSGELVLYPDNCQQTDARICKLDAELTYRSSRNNLVWQTDEWQDSNNESGTTDGASIPAWAQPIIGDSYDESYLKAAIVHDHYCYKENHVRNWRETHRMFYDALVDLNVDFIKAKIMYFSVYIFGPHWLDLVPGENCGENCIKKYGETRQRWEGDRYSAADSHIEIQKFKTMVETSPDMTVNEIEEYAKTLEPGSFFFNHGDSYTPNGPDDPKIRANM